MGRKWANIVAKKTAKDGANSKVYAKFEELYEGMRKTYEENYNFRAGGCRELINSVRCE